MLLLGNIAYTKMVDCTAVTTAKTDNILLINANADQVFQELVEGMIRVADHEDCLFCEIMKCFCEKGADERFPGT